jgi:hypothetical protein
VHLLSISQILCLFLRFAMIFLILVLQRTPHRVYELNIELLDFCPTQVGYILFRKMTTCSGLITKFSKNRLQCCTN